MQAYRFIVEASEMQASLSANVPEEWVLNLLCDRSWINPVSLNILFVQKASHVSCSSLNTLVYSMGEVWPEPYRYFVGDDEHPFQLTRENMNVIIQSAQVGPHLRSALIKVVIPFMK